MTTLLDTRGVAPSERPDYWSTGIAEHFFPMRVESVGSTPFRARLTGCSLGSVTVRSITGAEHSVSRNHRQIAQGDPDGFLLYMLRRGSCRITQDDRSCVLAPGDVAVHDTSRSSTFESLDTLDLAVFSLPRWLLGTRAGAIARCTSIKLNQGREPLAHLGVPFLARLARTVETSPFSEDEAERLSDVLVSMLWTLTAGGDVSASPPAAASGALLDRMRRYAVGHLDDPGLGPHQIAQAHFVSIRYVHKLFAAAGCGVSSWIREQRLERAMVELRDSPSTSIASIASRWGYRDPASFSRVFRQKFGCSPSEMRRRYT